MRKESEKETMEFEELIEINALDPNKFYEAFCGSTLVQEENEREKEEEESQLALSLLPLPPPLFSFCSPFSLLFHLFLFALLLRRSPCFLTPFSSSVLFLGSPSLLFHLFLSVLLLFLVLLHVRAGCW